jgi:curli biogenesis system outer membrane secretion channel CsgG
MGPMKTLKANPIGDLGVGNFRLRPGGAQLGKSFLVWVFICALVPACMAQQKKRVAVLNFEYGTVQSSVSAIFGTNQDIGKGISDMLVQKLVQDGKYSVIERNAIDKVLGEQNFANSDRVDSSTAAKVGRILGVDAVIMGSITQFGRDDKNMTVGGGGLGGYGSKFGLGGVGKHNAKAVVAITGRLVDTTTAEILAAVTGNGESTRSGTSLIGAGGGGGSAGGGGVDMSSSNFANTILGEALHQAVDSMATQLDDKAAALPTHKVEFTGLVADVTGNTLVLNVGSKDGVKVGDTIDISRPVKTVKDPTSGKVLRTITNKMGTATVTDVDAGSATATYTGSAPAKVGDEVKSQ